MELGLRGHVADVRVCVRVIGVEDSAENLDFTGGLGHQGADDAYHGRLTGSVGPQEGKKITLLYRKIDAFECSYPVFIGFLKIFYIQGVQWCVDLDLSCV